MNKFFTKRNIFAVCLALVVLLCVVLSVFVAVFCTPSQFSQTYYGQLTAMVEKLENVQGKKIVIIGTSSVAFGINSALLQQLLLDAGEQYTVCNFGLYGALGVKLMMQLALPYVKQGDVVLFSPEIDSQVLSLYFSAQHTWRAFDGNFRLLKNLDEQQQKYMAGGVVDFLQEKFSAQQHGGLSVEGVYAKSSFDSNGDLTQFARPHNIMTNGVDSNNPVDFSTQLPDDFVQYVNEFSQQISTRGATLYYNFAPCNKQAVVGNVEDFSQQLATKLQFQIVGNPHQCILDAGWFYDSNFHLNDAGMVAYTLYLCDALKTRFGNATPTHYVVPQMPEIPKTEMVNGDNSDEHCFVYKQIDGGYAITGIVPQTQKSQYVVPVSHDGQPVLYFESQVFAYNTLLESIVVQGNISQLLDGSFVGCSNLQQIVLQQTNPSKISVGWNLLDNTNATILVPQDCVANYANDYFWGHYSGRIRGY